MPAPAANVSEEGGQHRDAGQEASVESPTEACRRRPTGRADRIRAARQGGVTDLKDRPFSELTAADFKDAELGDELGSGGNKSCTP